MKQFIEKKNPPFMVDFRQAKGFLVFNNTMTVAPKPIDV